MRPNLATLVEDFRRHGLQTAIVTYRGNRQTKTSYAELADLACGFAAELARRGIGQGERVLLWGQNSAAWVGAFFGCLLRGVLAVPLDAAGSPEFARRVIADTQPRLVAGDAALLAQLEATAITINFDQVSQLRGPASLDPVPLTLDTPLQILFTSGTTAEPKGVVHTHRNILASLNPIEREMQKYLRYERIVHPLRILHTLPLSHVFGQFMGLWIPPLLGAEAHFESRIEAGRILDTIQRERISVLAAVPRALELLKNHLISSRPELLRQIEAAQGLGLLQRWWRFRRIHRAFGLKFWAFVCGGASLPSELERFWTTPGFALIQGYGMTETAALITLNHPFRIGKGTIGKLLPGREIRISDSGEMLVRGDMVSSASWQQGRMVTRADPWLATGDVIAQDEAGQMRFVGRKSDVIVTSSGLNIHPEDLEAALNRQPGVVGSAVVSVVMPNGCEPAAAIVAPGGRGVAEQAVVAANREMAEFQRVRHWRLWPEADLPRTTTGKIQRRKVSEWMTAQSSGVSMPVDGDALWSLMTAITGHAPQRTGDEARLAEDLGFDSLGRVQLQAALEERFGISVGEEAFSRIETLGQLRAIASAKNESMSTANSGSPIAQHDRRTGNGQAGLSKPAGPALTPHFAYPRWPWWPVFRVARVAFLELIVRPLVRLLANPAVDASLPGQAPDGPMILIANHATAFDVPLILYALPRKIRTRLAVAMAGEMIEDWRQARNQGSWWQNLMAPMQYWLVTLLFNIFPLPRYAGFRQSFLHAGHALDAGYNVLVFPEGRRSDDGRLLPFRSGIGLLAGESRASVLPIALQGVGDLKRSRGRWFRSGRITIRTGARMEIDPSDRPEEIAKKLQSIVRSLLDQ